MAFSRRRIARLGLGAVLLIAVIFGGRMLDRMALAYTTGFRRTFEAPVDEGPPREGATPGTTFLGFSRPAPEGEEGFVLGRVTAAGRDAGLRAGDRILRVDGAAYESARAVAGGLIRTRLAGESVEVEAIRDGEAIRVPLRLDPFIRHPGDLGLPYDDIEFASPSGHLIRGWWIPPPEGSDGRVVVWVHGAHSSRHQAFDHGAERLRERGYGILTVDLSGRGSSEGEYITYTMHERHDVQAAVEFSRGRPDVRAEGVVVFGTSNGASSSIYAGAALGDLPALALDAPYANLWQAAGSMLEARGANSVLRVPLAFFVWLRTGLRIHDVRPGDVITGIPGAVLFIHGDHDRQVPPHHSLEMHEARLAAGLPSRRWVLPGGEHGFDNYPPEGLFWNRVADFFDDALGGRPPGFVLAGPTPGGLDWFHGDDPGDRP